MMGEALAQRMWDALSDFGTFEEALSDMIGDFDKLGHDYYDASLEIHGVPNEVRLDEQAQRFISDAGFAKVYVNHADGWETHYSFYGKELPVRGWRRRYVQDANAETTNVIVGDENPGYYEISYWPEGWDGPGCADWLSSGYMRIVPDPLEALLTSGSGAGR